MTEMVRNAPEFRLLCNQCMKKIRHFESQQLVNLLQLLTSVRVGPKTNIMQASLQLTRERMNELDVNTINFILYLVNILSGRESDTIELLEALKIALPMVRGLKRKEEKKLEATRPRQKFRDYETWIVT
jgi:hypothetical protein